MKEFEPIKKESLSTILSNRKLHFSNRVANFYADIEQRDYIEFEESMIIFRWAREIFKEIKDGSVYLPSIREKLLKNNLSKKNNAIENLYFKIATSLAFSQLSIKENDWDKFFYYLLEAEKLKGCIIAIQDPKIYLILQNEDRSSGAFIKHENHKQKMEPIKEQALNMYHNLEYKRKHKLNNLSSFSRHFCIKFNEMLKKTNPEMSEKELENIYLKESTVKRLINPPKKKTT